MRKTSERIVSTTEIKPLNKKQLENLRIQAARPESEIDYSDIPEVKKIRVMGRGPLTAEDRKKLLSLSKQSDSELKKLPPGYVVGEHYRPRKTSLTIRIDADVLSWLRQTGEGYQTRINAYLRERMERGDVEASLP